MIAFHARCLACGREFHEPVGLTGFRMQRGRLWPVDLRRPTPSGTQVVCDECSAFFRAAFEAGTIDTTVISRRKRT
jgi:hypothetical protein